MLTNRVFTHHFSYLLTYLQRANRVYSVLPCLVCIHYLAFLGVLHSFVVKFLMFDFIRHFQLIRRRRTYLAKSCQARGKIGLEVKMGLMQMTVSNFFLRFVFCY